MVPAAMKMLIPVLVLSACSVHSGLNKPCTLVQSRDGGVVVAITEGQVQENQKAGSPTEDFIALGAVECDDSYCVRDSTYPKGADLTAPAQGYCSKECAPGIGCPSDDPALDKQASTALSCRKLLVSADLLAQLGLSAKEPFFCARGAPDAGTN